MDSRDEWTRCAGHVACAWRRRCTCSQSNRHSRHRHHHPRRHRHRRRPHTALPLPPPPPPSQPPPPFKRPLPQPPSHRRHCSHRSHQLSACAWHHGCTVSPSDTNREERQSFRAGTVKIETRVASGNTAKIDALSRSVYDSSNSKYMRAFVYY